MSDRSFRHCSIFGEQLTLPPEECCFDTKPNHAVESHQVLNCAMSGPNASTATTVIGPTPRMVWRGRAVSRLPGQRLEFHDALGDVRCLLCNLRQYVQALLADQPGQIGDLIFHKQRYAIKIVNSYMKHVTTIMKHARKTFSSAMT